MTETSSAPKPSVKERMAAFTSKGVKAGWDGIFFILSVIQYIAYFEGLSLLLQGVLPRWWVVLGLCVTYMFRLDFIAAIIGFYGAWKVWNWPVWGALMLTVFFGAMSYAVNYGPGKKPASFFRQLFGSRKKVESDSNATPNS